MSQESGRDIQTNRKILPLVGARSVHKSGQLVADNYATRRGKNGRVDDRGMSRVGRDLEILGQRGQQVHSCPTD